MAKKGELFVVTGIDGSGKATQVELFAQRLKKEGKEVATLDFPRYDKGLFGRHAARYLRGEFGDAAMIDPYLVAPIYALDRWEAKEELLQHAERGIITVCNRYVADNMAHQGCKIKESSRRRGFYGWVEEMEHTVFGLPHPDLYILLDVPVNIAQGLIENKAAREYLLGETMDMHERSTAHLRAAREAYVELSTLYFNWTRINCAPYGELLPREEIAEKVWAEAKRFLE